jgi:hypothetical protein
MEISFSEQIAGLVVRARRQDAQAAGRLSTKVGCPHGHRHGGNRCQQFESRAWRFFDPNQRFWQQLRYRWQSVTTIDRYSDDTPGGDLNRIGDKR